MTDERTLIEAVKAAPRDDAPRLIFADWLDENEQPERAAFIRWQCANRRSVLEAKGVVLEDWFADVIMLPEDLRQWWWDVSRIALSTGRLDWTWTWHRGFVCRVSMPGDDAYVCLDKLLEDWPITTVLLTAPLGQENLAKLQDEVMRWPGDERRAFMAEMMVQELPLPQRLFSVGRKHLLNLLCPAVRFRERLS